MASPDDEVVVLLSSDSSEEEAVNRSSRVRKPVKTAPPRRAGGARGRRTNASPREKRPRTPPRRSRHESAEVDEDFEEEKPLQINSPAAAISPARPAASPRSEDGGRHGRGSSWRRPEQVEELEMEDTVDDLGGVRVLEQSEPPPELTLPLLPFQKESLHWMTEREHSAFRGGILADEMGMGKTIQTISTIIANRLDELDVPRSGPDPYVSEGVIRVEEMRVKAEKKEAENREAARLRAEKKEAKEREAARRRAETKTGKQKRPRSQSPSGPSSKRAARSTSHSSGAVDDSKGELSNSTAAVSQPEPASEPEPVSEPSTSAPPTVHGGAYAEYIRSGAICDPSIPAEFAFSVAQDTSATKLLERSQTSKPRPAQAVDLLEPQKVDIAQSLRAPQGPASKCTLVVCPVVAVTQWKHEIERFTKPNTLSVLVYHGPKRSLTVEDMLQYDVVLTTYSVVQSEFRKMVEPSKMPCPYCGRLFFAQKLGIHLRQFCGPDAVRTEKQALTKRKRPRESPSKKKPPHGKKQGKGPSAKTSVGGGEKKSSGSLSSLRAGASATAASSASKTAAASSSRKRPSAASSSRKGPKPQSPESDDEVTWTGARGEPASGPSTPSGRPQRRAAPGSNRNPVDFTVADLFGSGSDAGSGSSSSGEDSDASFASKGKSDEESSDDSVELVDESEDSSSDNKRKASSKPQSQRGKKRTGKVVEASGDESLLSGDGSTEEDDDVEEEDEDAEGDDDNDDDRPRGDGSEASALGPLSVLQRIFWRRIVLDEAHAIKNRRSATAKAVFALTAERRWCLSGTPLQNRVGELYSLVRFLRVDPFAYYFCRNCPCKSLDYRFGKDGRQCELCGHSPLRHYCWWNRNITNPIKFPKTPFSAEIAMRTLRNDVLRGLLLRRTKASRAADMALPCRMVRLRRVPMDMYEQDFYQAMYMQSQAEFDRFAEDGVVLHNYAHIFDLLMRLRQAVDHPYLVTYSSSRDTSSEGTDVCGLCHEPVEDPVVSGCRHAFCRLCIREYLDVQMEDDAPVASSRGKPAMPTCPVCVAPLSVDVSQGSAETPSASGDAAPSTPQSRAASSTASSSQAVPSRRSILSRIPPDRVGTQFRSSSKIEALLEEIAVAREEDPAAKSIVFSQFVNMLDLIEHRLMLAGVRCVKLDGRMSRPARDRILHAFSHDPSVEVFLISLKAGGQALNLTAASRIFLMDPWWNPAAEEQALDRTHRLGQHRPITATRFIMEGTVEERILRLQDKKKLVFEGTVGKDAGALARLTPRDMMFLFGRV